MRILKLIKKMKQENRPITDIWHYFLGNYRYFFYYGGNFSKTYSLVAWLRKKVLRSHIKDQVAFRINNMDRDCYYNGECKICGCQTTHLQMCNKACEKPCYPPMMSRSTWYKFYNKGMAYKDYKTGVTWLYNKERNRLMKLTENSKGYVQIN